jgi:hypothetical protein
MNTEQVTRELVAILQECQQLFGHDDAESITPKTKPHGGLKGFQSDVVPTIVRRLARKLGEPLSEDVDPVNIFASDDRKEKLTVEEAAKRFLEHYGPKREAGNERAG